LKLAVHNAFAGKEVAETELARRMCLAARALGWQAREVASTVEIRSFAPDLVLALHFFTPKLTGHPTYGCMWNPPEFFQDNPGYVENVLSYDGYLSSSPVMTEWVRARLSGTAKKFFVAPFYASCNRTAYQPPDLRKPRLLYAGTNWDGQRMGELFLALDREHYVDVHGPPAGWKHLRSTYRGSLPFDGTSLVSALRRAGVGLCLHREEHRRAATPSLRIFEIAASGAIAICQEHPFIREAFGDSVLYLGPSSDASDIARQIADHMTWIASHREAALEMSRKAHAIFESRFTLEALLQGVAREHHELATAKCFVRAKDSLPSDTPRVEYVVRTGGRSTHSLRRALDSLVAQTVPGVGAVVVRYGDVDPTGVLESYRRSLPLRMVEGRREGVRSTHLWQGLQAVSGEYFGVLDDDDALHPNHVGSLLSLLHDREDAGVAYSGSIRVWEPGGDTTNGPEPPREPAALSYGQPFDQAKLFGLQNFITSNSFLGRSSLLRELPGDPELHVYEDLYLLILLSQRARFLYSQDRTSEHYWRADRSDNTVLGPSSEWTRSAERIWQMLWKEVAPPDARPVESHAAAVQGGGVEMIRELARRNVTIVHLQQECAHLRRECALRDDVIRNMESTKGWKIVAAWHKAKADVRSTASRIVNGVLSTGGVRGSPGSPTPSPTRHPAAVAERGPEREPGPGKVDAG
jgi:hypothetical protein